MSNKAQQALEHFIKLQSTLEKSLGKFVEGFQTNPHHALAWADGTFRDVAMLERVKQVVFCLTPRDNTPDLSIAQVSDILKENLINHNSCLSHSTSQCTNLLSFYKGQTIVEALEILSRFE